MKQDDPHYDARRAEYYAQGWWRDEDLWTSMSRTALARPAQPAFIGEDRAITFGELLRDAERFGRGLAARGINPGDVVILHARNSVETVVALVGCGWAGAPDDDATIRGEATMTSTLRMEVVAFLAVFAFLGAVVLGLF